MHTQAAKQKVENIAIPPSDNGSYCNFLDLLVPSVFNVYKCESMSSHNKSENNVHCTGPPKGLWIQISSGPKILIFLIQIFFFTFLGFNFQIPFYIHFSMSSWNSPLKFEKGQILDTEFWLTGPYFPTGIQDYIKTSCDQGKQFGKVSVLCFCTGRYQ